jgi:hypothetical protein
MVGSPFFARFFGDPTLAQNSALAPNEGVALGCAGGMVRPPSRDGMQVISSPPAEFQGKTQVKSQGSTHG